MGHNRESLKLLEKSVSAVSRCSTQNPLDRIVTLNIQTFKRDVFSANAVCYHGVRIFSKGGGHSTDITVQTI